VSLNDNYFTKLSEENKFYVIKNYKGTNNYDEVPELVKDTRTTTEDDFEMC
jgi:hypothetical protein